MVNIYLESTIKPPRKGEASGMWIVEYVQDKDPNKFVTLQGGCSFAETTEDAIILTLLAESLMRFHKPCEIRIFTKAQGVLNTLETRRFNTWSAQNWLKSDGKAVKNAHLWDIVARALEKHTWTVTDEDHSYREYMRSELKKCQ